MKPIAGKLVWGIVCCMLVMLISSAGAEDMLFQAEVALQSGDAPTQFTVWTSQEPAESFPEDPALLIEVVPPNGEAYMFLFPSYEGGEAEFLSLLRFTDINGDGSLDVEAVFALGASNLACTYYLFDPADGRVHYSAELGVLPNAAYDVEHHTILSQESEGAANKTYSLFAIVNCTPVLVRTASMNAVESQGDDYDLVVTVTSVITGETLLNETTPFSDNEAAVWNAQYERMMGAMLDGFENEITPVQPCANGLRPHRHAGLQPFPRGRQDTCKIRTKPPRQRGRIWKTACRIATAGGFENKWETA